MEINDQAITDFMEISGQDRRTALFFLQRRHGDINEAINEYFNNPDLPIPNDFMRDSTSSDSNEDNSNSSDRARIIALLLDDFTSESSSSSSSSHNDHSSLEDNNDLNSLNESHNSIKNEAFEPQISFSINEVDSSALISKKKIDFTEKEEDIISNNAPFPKQKSKGKSEKIFIYSNGILFLDKFYDKASSNEYNQIIKCLSCGYFPPNLVSSNFVDIEISNLQTQAYSK